MHATGDGFWSEGRRQIAIGLQGAPGEAGCPGCHSHIGVDGGSMQDGLWWTNRRKTAGPKSEFKGWEDERGMRWSQVRKE